MAKAGLSQIKIKLIFLLILLSAAGFLLYLNPENNNTNENVFKTNYALETPNIKDRSVADFYLWTKEDPLFTSPDFNSDSFYKAVEVLRSEENAYLDTINSKDRIFPTDFLLSLKEVDNAHREFIKRPTKDSGEALIVAYEKTTSYYKTDIEKLIAVVETINSDKFNRTNVVLLNTISDINIIKNDLQKLNENADKLQEEINSRKNCLEYDFSCQRPVSGFSDFKIIKNNYDFSKVEVLPKEVVSPYADFLIKGQWSGPYAVSTACLGWSDKLEPVPHLYYLVKLVNSRNFQLPSGDLTELNAKLATTNYYVGVDQNGNEQGNDFTNFNSRRIILESNVYDCLSSQYKATLASIDNLHKYKNDQVFGKLIEEKHLTSEQKQFFNKGAQLERAFFDAKYPSDIDAENIANYYALFYKKIIEWKKEPSINEASLINRLFIHREDFLNRYLEYQRRMGKIHEVITQAKNNFSSFRAKWIVNNNVPGEEGSKYIIYAVRSMYGLTYLPFTRSAYRLDSDLVYFPKEKVEFNTGYNKRFITYQEALQYYPLSVINLWSYDTSIELENRYRQYLLDHPKARK